MLNIFYSHLAYIWQSDMILCGFIIFSDQIIHINNYTFHLIITHIKNIQVNHMSIHYPIIGVFRMIFHFNSDLYLDLSEKVYHI